MAIKIHLLLDHERYLPTYAVITDGRVNDVRVAQNLQSPPDTVLVVDRGHLDYALYMVRYYGVLTAAARLRSRIVPEGPDAVPPVLQREAVCTSWMLHTSVALWLLGMARICTG